MVSEYTRCRRWGLVSSFLFIIIISFSPFVAAIEARGLAYSIQDYI